jgi:lambda family phage portal protein
MSIMQKLRDMIAPPVGAPSLPAPRAEFMRGGRGIVMAGWKPQLRDAAVDVGNAWNDAAARALDTIHNSGWIAGAIDQAVANTVGTGLRIKVAPENDQLGMTDEQAREWSRNVEQRFGLWANDRVECDIEGRRTFGQMQAAVLRSYFATGEAFAEIPWRKRKAYGTKVRLIASHRVSMRDDVMKRVQQGVRMDADGFPVAYIARKKDSVLGEVEWDVPAFDRLWRPRVVHCFDGMPGQVRGITPLVPALRVARQFDQLADATLTAAMVQATFAATITSDEPTEEVLSGLITPQEQARLAATGSSIWDAWFEAQSGWYDSATINVGINGRIAHLFPGQKMEFLSANHPNSDYKDFSLHLLREIARCLGLTYESATGDYEGATYSSVRMATGEVFQITQYRRAFIIAPFCQAAYEAWLEEEIEAGTIPFPGGIDAFHRNRAAACRALWRGAPKVQADENKAAQAHKTYRDMGVMTDEMIANDLGVDIEDVYVQRAREAEMRKTYGLKDEVERQEEMQRQQMEQQAQQQAENAEKDEAVNDDRTD